MKLTPMDINNKEFKKLRAKVLPFAETQRFFIDEDIFKMVSWGSDYERFNEYSDSWRFKKEISGPCKIGA